jgi:hypothetical protein
MLMPGLGAVTAEGLIVTIVGRGSCAIAAGAIAVRRIADVAIERIGRGAMARPPR